MRGGQSRYGGWRAPWGPLIRRRLPPLRPREAEARPACTSLVPSRTHRHRHTPLKIVASLHDGQESSETVSNVISIPKITCPYRKFLPPIRGGSSGPQRHTPTSDFRLDRRPWTGGADVDPGNHFQECPCVIPEPIPADAGESRPASADRYSSPSCKTPETPPPGPSVLGDPVTLLGGLALKPRHRQARNRYPVAQERVQTLLAVEI